jgi:hypothetical protein
LFDEDVTTPTVLGRLKERKLRPATLFELASAALTDRTLGTSSVVAALGSCDVNHVGGPASPAATMLDGKRAVTLMGFCHAWPRGTEFLALPIDLPAGLGNVAHNHLLPIEQKRSPKLVFKEPPLAETFEVSFDSGLAIRDAAKRAKFRNVADAIDDESRFPPPAGAPATSTLSMTVFTLNRKLPRTALVTEMAARGLRPATLRELVALAIASPDVFESRAIWALGDPGYAGMYKAGGRVLGVHHGMTDTTPWDFDCWFAGVRTSGTSASTPKKTAKAPTAPANAKAPAKAPARKPTKKPTKKTQK